MHAYPSIMTLLSPLAHTERSIGIDAKFRRIAMILGGEIRRVPVLSGNAIRGLLRRASMQTLLERVGVARGSLPPAWIYLLSAGGSLAAGETRKVFDPAAIRALRELVVPLGAFGGSVPGRSPLPGQVDIDMAVPITVETRDLVGANGDATLRLSDLLEEIAYSRKDDLAEREEQGVQMRYSVECLRAGVRLAHGLTFRTDDLVLRGCVWDAVARVAAQRLGGKGATGHGRFSWTWTPEPDAVAAYHAHLDVHRDALRARLGEPL